MVEELILSGADIIKVGIGPGSFSKGAVASFPALLLSPASWEERLGMSLEGESSIHLLFLFLRVCVHYPQEDRSRLPSAQCSAGVCRCRPRPGGTYHLGELGQLAKSTYSNCEVLGSWPKYSPHNFPIRMEAVPALGM